ncbi:short-chain collagen C4-like [Dreissena polymorpha]|uniref:short-chain collagen C4-like n=1 Tax=Dreissena polymorpha TaxID=45954 RepID=UPI002263F2BC|nr:short-chain collagen C4-like [Dreissena polymorpha]
MAFISVMLMVLCLVVLSETTEPLCSPFNYEEKLLEKMVRNEFKMEQALKRIDDFEVLLLRTNRKIQGAIGTLKEIEARLDSKLSMSSIGATYIRWGRSSCPHSNNSLVYHGFAAGTHYSSSGGAADYQCLPVEPELETVVTRADYISNIYQSEYLTHGATGLSSLANHEVPCAVCFTNVSSTIMIPARKTCYIGWKLEYRGFLMTERDNHANNKQYVCVDKEPEAAPGSNAAYTNSVWLGFVFPTCGTLKCPPYNSASALACVVCSKL